MGMSQLPTIIFWNQPRSKAPAWALQPGRCALSRGGRARSEGTRRVLLLGFVWVVSAQPPEARPVCVVDFQKGNAASSWPGWGALGALSATPAAQIRSGGDIADMINDIDMQ